MKRFFNYSKFNIKKNFVSDILFLAGAFFLFIILIINVSVTIYEMNIKIEKDNYNNCVVAKLDNDENINFFSNYELLGWQHDKIKINNNPNCASVKNSYMFNRYKIPLVQGRMPIEEGDTLVPYGLKNTFKIGKTYTLENEFNITIVGYKMNDMSLSINYPFSDCDSKIEVLSNNKEMWLNSGFLSEIFTYYIFNVPMEAQKQAEQQNLEFKNVTNYADRYFKGLGDETFGRFILTSIGLFLFLIFILTKSIIKDKANQQNYGICYMFGQSKFNLIFLRLLKEILGITLISLGSLFFMFDSFGKDGFLLTWKGYIISIIILITIFITYAISDYIKLKKLNFSEILNFREN